MEKSKWDDSARKFQMIVKKADVEEEGWPRVLASFEKNPKIAVDWDKWQDSDDEELPDENAHWNADTHRAFTGGQNGGIDVEQMSKLPFMKHAFRTVDIGGMGGGPPPEA